MTQAMSTSLWDDPNQISVPVAEKSRESGQSVTSGEWKRWKSHQRYALYKTALSKSDPEQFFAVLAEIRENEG
jgi:Conserved nitrate reductase-associated protein (Nitr_red_assoc).